MKIQKQYDVCIIGAGPAGLATLSAIHEPYSVDTMNEMQWGNAATQLSKLGPSEKKVCVIDPNEEWLGAWSNNFSRLEIELLRSPAIAHPDHFDMRALLTYAVANGREDELIESGCSEIRKLHGLGQTQVGLWKLPSTSLFEDFSRDLARSLQHDYIKATVSDVIQSPIKEEGYIVHLSDDTYTLATSVVLALGQSGVPIVPNKLREVPKHQLLSWHNMRETLLPEHKSILVMGGGLTAVQAAQLCLRQGKKVVLCSRRPLVERHFDIEDCWFDKRYANKHISEFYHQDESDRLRQLKDVRGGGSVPPIYMNDLRKWQEHGKLTLVNKTEPEFTSQAQDGTVLISIDGDTLEFDCVILACGIETNCLKNPLIKKIHHNFPIRIVGGYPSISVDLEWAKNLFIVGALAGLNVGPDAANIMGARRAASVVAGNLECKSWLRQEAGALSNKFMALAFSDEEDSSSESE